MALPKPKNEDERKKVKLAADLQQALDETGNTPINESERFEIIKKEDDFEVINELWGTYTEFKDKKVSAEQQSIFIERVIEKITSFSDENGEYKDTENTKECNVPSLPECSEITKRAREFDLKWSHKKQIEYVKKIKEEILKISGLNKDKLTEWEQTLVVEQIKAYAFGNTNAAVGKYIKN